MSDESSDTSRRSVLKKMAAASTAAAGLGAASGSASAAGDTRNAESVDEQTAVIAAYPEAPTEFAVDSRNPDPSAIDFENAATEPEEIEEVMQRAECHYRAEWTNEVCGFSVFGPKYKVKIIKCCTYGRAGTEFHCKQVGTQCRSRY